MTAHQIVQALIYTPMVTAWIAPVHIRAGGPLLQAWVRTFLDAIAAIEPSEAEARAAFLAVSQTHGKADWPPAAAFVAAIRKSRLDAHGGRTAEPIKRPIDALKHEAQRQVDAWLLYEADWVKAFLATFQQQRTDPPVTKDNLTYLASLPATDRDMAHWHLVEILKRKAWLRAQRDVLGQHIDPLQLTEGDVTIIQQRIASQPYERHGRYSGSR